MLSPDKDVQHWFPWEDEDGYCFVINKDESTNEDTDIYQIRTTKREELLVFENMEALIPYIQTIVNTSDPTMYWMHFSSNKGDKITIMAQKSGASYSLNTFTITIRAHRVKFIKKFPEETDEDKGS